MNTSPEARLFRKSRASFLLYFPVIFIAMVLITAFGCGQQGDPNAPTLYPVTGTITMDGKPLSDANVTFIPVSETKGRGSFARTGADGKYDLQYDDFVVKPGAAQGNYKVVVSREVMANGSPVPKDMADSATAGTRESIPQRYSDFQQSELQATIPAGPATFDFALKSK